MNRQNFDVTWKQPVDDPVAPHNDFPNVFLSDLRDNAAQTRKLRKAIRGLEHAFHEYLGVSRSVAGNEKTNRIEIIQRLGCPGYSSHRAIRCRASA